MISIQFLFSQESDRVSTIVSVQVVKKSKEKDPIRVSGYLFIYTSISEYDSKTKEPTLGSPKRLFFIPLKTMKSNFEEAIKSFNSQKSDEIFVPFNLTSSESDVSFINVFLKNNLFF